MSMDINVYLRNKGGGRTRAQGLLSTKETHTSKKQNSKNETKLSGFPLIANQFVATNKALQSGLMGVPIIRQILVAGKVANRGFNFGIKYSLARTGERMLSNNAKAMSKALTSLGGSVVHGAIDNALFRVPEVARQNQMIQYGRELYLSNIENEKNKFG